MIGKLHAQYADKIGSSIWMNRLYLFSAIYTSLHE